jgi:hypothetical protein
VSAFFRAAVLSNNPQSQVVGLEADHFTVPLLCHIIGQEPTLLGKTVTASGQQLVDKVKLIFSLSAF